MVNIDETLDRFQGYISQIERQFNKNLDKYTDEGKIQAKNIASKTIDTIINSIDKYNDFLYSTKDDIDLNRYLYELENKCKEATRLTIAKIDSLVPVEEEMPREKERYVERVPNKEEIPYEKERYVESVPVREEIVEEEQDINKDSIERKFVNIINGPNENQKSNNKKSKSNSFSNILNTKHTKKGKKGKPVYAGEDNLGGSINSIKKGIIGVGKAAGSTIYKMLDTEKGRNALAIAKIIKDKAVEVYNEPDTQKAINEVKIKTVEIAEKGLDNLKEIFEKDKEENKENN